MPRKKALAGTSKRHPLNMRTTKELRERLERAAKVSGRSLVQEVEGRIEESLEDEQMGALQNLHGLIRLYLRSVGWRREILPTQDPAAPPFELSQPEITEALRMGFDLILSAACFGPLTEERIKKFWLEDILELSGRGGDLGGTSANIAVDAFNVLSAAGLANYDQVKLSQWIRDAAGR